MKTQGQILGLDFDVPASMCPACGYIVDAALNATPERGGNHGPKVGDLSVCMNCGEVLMFKRGLQVEQAGSGAWDQDPQLNLVRAYIQKRGRLHE